MKALVFAKIRFSLFLYMAPAIQRESEAFELSMACSLGINLDKTKNTDSKSLSVFLGLGYFLNSQQFVRESNP